MNDIQYLHEISKDKDFVSKLSEIMSKANIQVDQSNLILIPNGFELFVNTYNELIKDFDNDIFILSGRRGKSTIHPCYVTYGRHAPARNIHPSDAGTVITNRCHFSCIGSLDQPGIGHPLDQLGKQGDEGGVERVGHGIYRGKYDFPP
mgnify:CR=1 FL=1